MLVLECLFAAYQGVATVQNHRILAFAIYDVRPLVALNSIRVLAAKDLVLGFSTRNRVFSSLPVDDVPAIVPLDLILAPVCGGKRETKKELMDQHTHLFFSLPLP